MELSADQVRRLATHIGYGNPAAPVWLIGGEEGLGGAMDQREQAENLASRAKWEPVMDMAKAHCTLREAGSFIVDLVNRPGSTVVWRFMARIARAFEDEEDWDGVDAAKEYVRDRLGRADDCTFLTELSPFPARRQQPMALRDFADRKLIDETLIARRAEQIEFLREHRPKMVICYGGSLHRRFEQHFNLKWQLFSTVHWSSQKGNLPRKTQLYRSEIPQTTGPPITAFRLPFFGNGALSIQVLRSFVTTVEFQACRP